MNDDQAFTKDQVHELLDPLVKIITNRDKKALMNFNVPLSRATSVEMRFHGPVGASELEALSKHITLFRSTLQEGNDKHEGSAAEQICDVLRRAGFLFGERGDD